MYGMSVICPPAPHLYHAPSCIVSRYKIYILSHVTIFDKDLRKRNRKRERRDTRTRTGDPCVSNCHVPEVLTADFLVPAFLQS